MAKVYTIGFAGPAGAGKDAAANRMGSMLAVHQPDKLTTSVYRLPMAGVMKEMVGIIIDSVGYVNGELLLEDRGFKEKPLEALGGVTPRKMMQTLGTEWGRKLIDEDLWVNVAKQRIARIGNSSPVDLVYVLITDIRFNNEAPLCDAILRVNRDDVSDVPKHASEKGIFKKHVKWEVDNNGTLVDLRFKIHDITREIMNENERAFASARKAG